MPNWLKKSIDGLFTSRPFDWIKTVISELFTPSPQKGDWYGWTTNQISHAFLGIFAFWILLFLGFHVLIAFFVPVLIMLVKEGIDLVRGGSSFWDSFTDFAFVLYGVLIALFTWDNAGAWFLGANAVMAVVLFYGIYKRIKQKGTTKRE